MREVDEATLRQMAEEEESSAAKLKQGITTKVAQRVIQQIAIDEGNRDYKLNKELSLYSALAGLFVGIFFTLLYFKGFSFSTENITLMAGEIWAAYQTVKKFYERLIAERGELAQRIIDKISSAESQKAMPGVTKIFIRKPN